MGASGAQKRASGLLELELQTVVSLPPPHGYCQVWGPLCNISTFNYGVIPPILFNSFLNMWTLLMKVIK